MPLHPLVVKKRKASSSRPSSPTFSPKPTPTPPHSKSQEQIAHYKALIVEDNMVNQRLLRAMLARLGLQADTVDNGQMCLDIIKERGDYSLILMDISMPVLDGISATKILRNAGYAQPIIAVTAHCQESDLSDCLEAGMNEVLCKPVKVSSLQGVMESYLN
eukprot:TRINITY_DN16829_c0_g1_i1.p1 TRINITY_DN16829_c0_g1~~TRINITY_DN16829_c0_g1_i1.p1  ORF type:complete len:161 (+),score=25.04 TRINITY_DN16829_c0_g1_i1:3-485(+)